jgi:redox-sensitive bicupin YhaK (pirin superfamily)
MTAGARFVLPAARTREANRRLYFFKGSKLSVARRSVSTPSMIELRPDADVELRNGDEASELLMLQGKPIGEPVVQYGPFVMNSEAEIRQAMLDYRTTEFGGWPWDRIDPVHPRAQARFARSIDGTLETPISN